MLNSPSMPQRIARISILSTLGLLLSYACGYTTSGTIMVYACLINMYATTLKSAQGIFKKRILIAIISIPVTVAILFALKLTGLPPLIRLPLGAAIGVPLLLAINHRFKLGFSEVSQVVTVAILTGTFEGNNWFFLLRVFFIVAGISMSYLSYAYVFPLRHDKVFEAQRIQLQEGLRTLANSLHDPEYGSTTVTTLKNCLKLHDECGKHLQVIIEDVDVKRQYRDYQGRVKALVWELECDGCFLHLAESIVSHRESDGYSAQCRAYIAHESRRAWNGYQDSLSRLDQNKPLPEQAEPWDNSHLSLICSEQDFHIVYLLSQFKVKCFSSRNLSGQNSAATV